MGWRSNNLNPLELFQDFLPQYSQLHLCKPITHTAMDTEPKTELLPCLGTVNPKPISLFNDATVTISRDIPH
jgi:hypothetical protein